VTLLFAESEQFTRNEELFDRVDLLARRVRKDLGESLTVINNNSLPLARVTTRSLEALQLYSRATDAIVQGDADKAQALLQSALELDPGPLPWPIGDWHASIYPWETVRRNSNT